MNLDRSHFWWHGADPPRVIGEKDTTVYPEGVDVREARHERLLAEHVEADQAPFVDHLGLLAAHDVPAELVARNPCGERSGRRRDARPLRGTWDLRLCRTAIRRRTLTTVTAPTTRLTPARLAHLDRLTVLLVALVIAAHGILGYFGVEDVWP